MDLKTRLICLLLLSFFSIRGGQAQPLAELLPPQTFVLATFQDLRELDAKQLKTAWGQFCELPGTKAFFQNWNRDFASFRSFVDQWVQEQSGLPLEEVLRFLQGEISVAFLNPGPAPLFIAFFEKGNRDSLLPKFLEKSLGSPVPETFEGEILLSFSAPPPNQELVICASTSGLWISNSKDFMKQVLQKRQQKDPNNLSQTPLYQKHRNGNERMFVLINPELLFVLAPQEVKIILEALGIFECNGISLSYGYEGDYLLGRSRFSFRNAPIGIFSPSRPEGLQPEFLNHLRGHLVSATACSFSLKEWINLIHQYLTTLSPKEMEEYKKMNKELKTVLGVGFEELANIFGDIYLSWKFKREGAIQSIHAIELRSPQTLLSLLPKLEQAPYVTLLKREYKGTPIYQVNLETNLSEELGAVILAVGLYFYGIPTNFIIHKNQLILATLPHTLQDYLDLQGTTGDGPLHHFAEQAKGKQFFSLSYNPKESAENYRNTLYLLKRFETVVRTFGVPLDLGVLPRSKDVFPLIKPHSTQVYFANQCLNFEMRMAFPLGAGNTTLFFGSLGMVSIGSALAIPEFLKVRSRAQEVQCLNQIKSLEMALRMYESDYGFFPPAGDENLVIYLDGDPQNGGPKRFYFEFASAPENHLMLDVWGNPYHYQTEKPGALSEEVSAGIFIWSDGPNRINEFGEGDDIRNWD